MGAAEDATPGEMVLGCYHTKVNEVAPRPPFGLRFDFDGEDGPIAVASCPLTDGGADLMDKLPLRARIRNALAPGALTSEEIATHTGAPVAQVTARCRELVRMHHVVKLDALPGRGHQARWGLTTKGQQ